MSTFHLSATNVVCVSPYQATTRHSERSEEPDAKRSSSSVHPDWQRTVEIWCTKRQGVQAASLRVGFHALWALNDGRLGRSSDASMTRHSQVVMAGDIA